MVSIVPFPPSYCERIPLRLLHSISHHHQPICQAGGHCNHSIILLPLLEPCTVFNTRNKRLLARPVRGKRAERSSRGLSPRGMKLGDWLGEKEAMHVKPGSPVRPPLLDLATDTLRHRRNTERGVGRVVLVCLAALAVLVTPLAVVTRLTGAKGSGGRYRNGTRREAYSRSRATSLRWWARRVRSIRGQR